MAKTPAAQRAGLTLRETANRRHGMRHPYGGFVLIELVVVVGLIGLIAAVAFPFLIPVIAFSETEGAARHLASYGQSAMAHCALMKERITVKFDLDNREYWCVRWPEPEDENRGDLFEEDDGEGENARGLFNLGMSPDEMAELDETALADEALRMQEQFDRFARMALQTRARNARRESIMDEFGPLFEKEFTLDIEEEEEEEIVLPLLSRTRLPHDVRIESVIVGATEYEKGMVEIDLSPLGLFEPVWFYIEDVDEEYYTIKWDPITGLTSMSEGKEEPV